MSVNMAHTSLNGPSNGPSDAKTAKIGILIAAIVVLLVMVVGAHRLPVAQQYLSVTTGSAATTELINIRLNRE
jgi:purine-cytosine permease-like protein